MTAAPIKTPRLTNCVSAWATGFSFSRGPGESRPSRRRRFRSGRDASARHDSRPRRQRDHCQPGELSSARNYRGTGIRGGGLLRDRGLGHLEAPQPAGCALHCDAQKIAPRLSTQVRRGGGRRTRDLSRAYGGRAERYLVEYLRERCATEMS